VKAFENSTTLWSLVEFQHYTT